MFPEQNLHYLRNYHVGYQGVNYVKGSEYSHRYMYDQGKAILAMDPTSPVQYRRRSLLELPARYANQANLRPPYAPSLPSHDLRRQPYPESLLSENESLPPLGTHDGPNVSQPGMRSQADDYKPSLENSKDLLRPPSLVPDPPEGRPLFKESLESQEPQEPRESKEFKEFKGSRESQEPAEPRRLQPSQPGEKMQDRRNVQGKVGDDEWRRLVRQQAQEAEVERAKAASERRVNVLSYREELNRQVQEKAQRKDLARSLKMQEMQKAQDWAQEMAKQDKVKLDHARQMQEATRQFYDHQVRERSGLPRQSPAFRTLQLSNQSEQPPQSPSPPPPPPPPPLEYHSQPQQPQPQRHPQRQSQPQPQQQPQPGASATPSKTSGTLDSLLRIQEENRLRYRQVEEPGNA